MGNSLVEYSVLQFYHKKEQKCLKINSIESLPVMSKEDRETCRDLGALVHAEHFKLLKK